MSKDAVAHAIVRARKTFEPPPGLNVDTSRIRSHSGRHRMINDLKASGVSTEVGMMHSRIKSHKVYEAYGRMSDEQVGQALNGNKSLKKTLKKIYK